MFKAAVITLSDKGAAGLREDKSGPIIKEMLEESGLCHVCEEVLIGDEAEELKAHLIRMSDKERYDLILTTGGTGMSPRDITPEATCQVADRMVPGIAEYMRYKSFEITPRAMLSRAVAAMRGQTLIINLPGSPKAVRENLSFIMPALEHGLEIMTGRAAECGSDDSRAKDKADGEHKTKKAKREVSFLDGNSRNRIDEGIDPRALCQRKFREDITLEGMNVAELEPGDIIRYEGELFEISEVGKKCFDSCKLYQEEGPCFLARHCAFGRRVKEE